MNYTKRRLNKILHSTSKQTRKRYKTNKKGLLHNTNKNRKQFNLRSNTLKHI
jgi:hypothetical protein